MTYQVTAGAYPLRLNETGTVDSVLQNIAILLTTFKGTVPLDRDFGMDAEILDRPAAAARVLYMAEIRETIETYEPRATVRGITFRQSGAQLIPTVEVEISAQ